MHALLGLKVKDRSNIRVKVNMGKFKVRARCGVLWL